MKALFLALFLGIGLLSAVTFASPIGPATGSQRIQVVSQDFVDSQLAYTFTKVNDTLWHATFTFDNVSFAADVRFAFNKQCSHNAWLSLNNYYFSEWNMTTQELCNEIKNMTNYPTKAGNHSYIANFKWNQTALGGSFDIVYPNGWFENEQFKFGWNSTVATGLTVTAVLSKTGRAICRTTNRIHVVWTDGTSVLYSNSSDGVTWGTPADMDGGAVPSEPPVIDCKDDRIVILWIDSDSRKDINYKASNNEGAAWDFSGVWRDGTGASANAFHVGNVQFGANTTSTYNIWATYSWDGGTVESIYIDEKNFTIGGVGAVSSVDLGVDCDVNSVTVSTVYVNVTGTTENVYVPYGCSKTNNELFNYTNNSGTNWYGSIITTGTTENSLSFNILNNVLYSSIIKGMTIGDMSNSTNGNSWATITNQSLGIHSTSISSDKTSNIYDFYSSVCSITPSDNCDVGLATYNSSGWFNINSYIDLNSNNATLPNAIKDNSVDSTKIDFVYFNKSAIIYDYISLGAPPDTPPTFASYNANTTTVGKPANISIVISDAVSLSGFIFGSNNTGVWSNSTFAALSSGQIATNVTTLNNTVNTKVGISFYANDSINQWSIYNATITTTAADTCTYSSGDWFIKCADNCDLSSAAQNIGGNNIIVYGNGTAGQIIFANVNASIFYMNASQCNVRFKKPFYFTLKR